MRWVVGGRAVTQKAASTSQMGRFETEVMSEAKNLAALTDLSGHWIDRVHARRERFQGLPLSAACPHFKSRYPQWTPA